MHEGVANFSSQPEPLDDWESAGGVTTKTFQKQSEVRDGRAKDIRPALLGCESSHPEYQRYPNGTLHSAEQPETVQNNFESNDSVQIKNLTTENGKSSILKSKLGVERSNETPIPKRDREIERRTLVIESDK